MEFWLVVIASAVWVFIDANSIGVRKGLVPGFFDSGPVGWSAATLLLWIVAFPAYLILRSKFKAAAEAATEDGDPASVEAPAAQPSSVQPAPAPSAAAQPAPAQPAPVERSATTDGEMIASLEKLADLRDRGVLSGEEFEQKKMQLLAS